MLAKKKIPIKGLLEGYEAALAQTGYSINTKLLLVKRAELMIRRHLNTGLVYFDQTVINHYVSEIDDRYFKGNMQKKHYERTKREIDRFISYVCTGRIDALPSTLRGARQELTPKFERIAEEFIAGDFHPNTHCDIRWVTYKYFAWLEKQGFHDITGVGAIHIQKFHLACSEHYPPSTIHNIRLYLKKLYAFLYAAGQTEDDYSALFSFAVNREKRVFPVLPKADIAKLLDTIDRSTVKGKRDYAMMMLRTVLGLRACDVIALKLTDIDWLRGEIRIVQSKTSNPVVLPLTQDVGEALKDYILNARPSAADNRLVRKPYKSMQKVINTLNQRYHQTQIFSPFILCQTRFPNRSNEIFLRIKAPHKRLAAAVTVGEIYRDCCLAAGLPASARFHNLRRALGTSMVTNGISVYDVAQVFGDRNVNSTIPYLATDTEHLKMCALSFAGIAPAGGDPQ